MLSSLKLSSKTIIGKQEAKKLKNILQSLLSSNDSVEFRAPVDWKGLGLLDYGYLIKNPMDLGTVVNKLNEQKYLFAQQALDDIQLVWDNCKTYNPQNSYFYNLAEKLERSFKKMVKNYLPNISIVVPGRNNQLSKDDKKGSLANLGEDEQRQQVSYNEKIKFSQKLKTLSPMDLGTIVQQLIERCPSAFKQTGQQTAQLILDNLDDKTLRQIKLSIQSILSNGQDKVVKKLKLQ